MACYECQHPEGTSQTDEKCCFEIQRATDFFSRDPCIYFVSQKFPNVFLCVDPVTSIRRHFFLIWFISVIISLSERHII